MGALGREPGGHPTPSSAEQVHFLQIWIKPQAPGITPSYEQKYFAPEEKRGKLRLIASADAGDSWTAIVRDLPRVLSVEAQVIA